MLAEWASKYVGIPFKARGRDRSGCDCWGLVRLVLKEEYGREVPAFDVYDDPCDIASNSEIIARETTIVAERTSSPMNGDLALFTSRGLPAHVGIIANDGVVLHVERGSDAVLERIESPRLAARLEGVYRVR
jgi:cell wall-associated NlpC family hydrolase